MRRTSIKLTSPFPPFPPFRPSFLAPFAAHSLPSFPSFGILWCHFLPSSPFCPFFRPLPSCPFFPLLFCPSSPGFQFLPPTLFVQTPMCLADSKKHRKTLVGTNCHFHPFPRLTTHSCRAEAKSSGKGSQTACSRPRKSHKADPT